mmetsp:Transcript_19980/g.40485  ORF Transcript_19980/g.40485 Transcript_19980/m.40485 type:complete len:153 (-) Transcript_19980:409-867(-)
MQDNKFLREVVLELNNAGVTLLESLHPEHALDTFADAIEVILSGNRCRTNEHAVQNIISEAKVKVFRAMTRITMSKVWPNDQRRPSPQHIRPMRICHQDEPSLYHRAEISAVILYNMALINEFHGVHDENRRQSVDRALLLYRMMEEIMPCM